MLNMSFKARILSLQPSRNEKYPETTVRMKVTDNGGELLVKVPPSTASKLVDDALYTFSCVLTSRISSEYPPAIGLTWVSGDFQRVFDLAPDSAPVASKSKM